MRSLKDIPKGCCFDYDAKAKYESARRARIKLNKLPNELKNCQKSFDHLVLLEKVIRQCQCHPAARHNHFYEIALMCDDCFMISEYCSAILSIHYYKEPQHVKPSKLADDTKNLTPISQWVQTIYGFNDAFNQYCHNRSFNFYIYDKNILNIQYQQYIEKLYKEEMDQYFTDESKKEIRPDNGIDAIRSACQKADGGCYYSR